MQNISTGENVSIKIRQYFSNVYFGHCGFISTAVQRECAHLTSSMAQIKKKKKGSIQPYFLLIWW